jgi:hypothetical protein
MQHGRLVGRGQFFVLKQFVDFVLTEFVIYLVGKIAGINKGLLPTLRMA